jgi:hypothetical protein
MAKIRRTSDLKPGRYFAGETATGEKLFRSLTADDLRKHVEGTKALLSKGYAPPLLLEHAPVNSKAGAPVLGWDKKAKNVRNGAGWLTDVFQNKDGSIGYELDVRDAEIAKKFNDGSIKFTSPELRPSFTTGDGTAVPFVVSHVAATHTPRNPHQATPETIAMAMQFSLDDLEDEDEDEEVEVTDEDQDGKPEIKVDAEVPVDPDAEVVAEEPTSDTIDIKLHKSVFDTFVGMAKSKGMALPDDLTPESLFPAMISAMSGVALAEDETKIVEESAPQQYSLGDLNKPETPKLLTRAIRSEVSMVKANIKGIKIPALQKEMESLASSMQFSVNADELPTITVTQMLAAIHKGLPSALDKLVQGEGQQFSLAEHPDSQFFTNGHISPEMAKQIVDKQAEVVPMLRR